MPQLGALLVQQQLVSQDIIEQALRIQVGNNRRLGYILVKMKAITADQLVETLSKQLNIPICDIAKSFYGEVRKLLPQRLCKKYSVLPLTLKDDNTLEVAMADPADERAIRDPEDYTGTAIEARLARLTDIIQEIPKRIPISLADFLTPTTNAVITWLAVILAFSLLVSLSNNLVTQKSEIFTQKNMLDNFIHDIEYGTITVSPTLTTYQHHGLKLEFNNNGKINLSDHAAYAESSYTVSFEDLETTRFSSIAEKKTFPETK